MLNSFIYSLSSSGFFGFLLFILVAIILFIVFRDITLWYFRINENTDSLKRIADSLEEISSTLAADEIITEEVAVDEKDNDK
jgi:hypothetical protein